MRGSPANVGDIRIAPNGYSYTKMEGCWKLTHHLVAEEVLGRPINGNEIVKFKDGDRTNMSPDNIVVIPKRTATLRKRRAQVIAKIRELQAELVDIDAQIKAESSQKLKDQQ